MGRPISNLNTHIYLKLSNESARPNPPWPDGPVHINGSEWVGPLDS